MPRGFRIVAVCCLLLVAFLIMRSSTPVKLLHARMALKRLNVDSRGVQVKAAGFRFLNSDFVLSGHVNSLDDFNAVARSMGKILGPTHFVDRVSYPRPEGAFGVAGPVGIVSITIDTRYDDSDESLARVRAILALPQSQNVDNVANWTRLSQFIVSYYGFGPADLPKTYGLLLDSLMKLNGLVLPDAQLGEALKIPLLPPRSRPAIPPAPAGAAGVLGGVLGGVFGVRSYAYSGNPTGSVSQPVDPLAVHNIAPRESLRPAEAHIAVQVFPKTEEQTLRALGEYGVYMSHVLTLNLQGDDEQLVSEKEWLKGDELAAVRRALSQPIQRHPVLFVLDTGWPDESTYGDSHLALRKIFASVRQGYEGVPDSLPPSDPPFVALPRGDASHALLIEHALAPLVKLGEDSKAVTVVYVPLSKLQNSEPYLVELLTLFEIIGNAQSKHVTPDQYRVAQDAAREVIASTVPQNINGASLNTEEDILIALWTVAGKAFTEQEDNAFFVNESWTALPNTPLEGHPGQPRGLAVVAAGNVDHAMFDVSPNNVDFAEKAVTSMNVLSVMNVESVALGDLSCGSSTVSPDNLQVTQVVGYDGDVGPSDKVESGVRQEICGTSFAAPRVAWMLALDEATRQKHIGDNRSWIVGLHQKLMGVHKTDERPWQDILFRPEIYLSETNK